MIEYRSFCNIDPPRLVTLWNESPLGRGVASGISTESFESLNLSQPYFDPEGLILAFDGEELVGFVHAGFGANEDESNITSERGVICAILVHPGYRRRGIGRELLSRAEKYLRDAGAKLILAGPAEGDDPFYFGLYGGSQPSGFLESDPDAAPFFLKHGYEVQRRHFIYQCNLEQQKTPMSFRLVAIRRKMEVAAAHQPPGATWWWFTRFGRLESLRFVLRPRDGGAHVAAMTIIGLDLYMTAWQERVVGLAELDVLEAEHRKGYGQTLVLDVCKRLRDELVTRVEAHAPEENAAINRLLETCGFVRVDTGIVYRRLEA
ncbi:MAG: GNAT family N-acetyltransferase [Planctomycetaceae bacterium]